MKIGSVEFGERLTLIAGPCVIEDEDETLRNAETLAWLCERLGVGFVFKSSFDKANRTSAWSYRGPGPEAGVRILERVRAEVGCPVLTDMHEPWQAREFGERLDCLQIPAFLCRQTDLIVAAAAHGRAVNIKKGQMVAPGSMRHAVEKAAACEHVSVTERGACFGYGDLVVDMRSLAIMSEFAPVIFDATHSVQTPGGATTGGRREFVPLLARAAVAAGVAAIFAEVHHAPDQALSDGPNMLPLDEVEGLLESLVRIHEAVGHG